MIVKIRLGIGRPGKLWTGYQGFFPTCGCREDEGLDGKVAYVEFVENYSRNGSTTRRLFGGAKELTPEQERAIEMPTLFISAGGAGSVGEGADGTRIWNWSGRIGGNIILNPIMVEVGRYWEFEADPLAKPRPGYKWIETYFGDTLREYVLVQVDENDAVHVKHIMPCHRWHRETLSPPEKEASGLFQKEIGE